MSSNSSPFFSYPLDLSPATHKTSKNTHIHAIMGRFLSNQDFHAKRKKVIMELLKGKEIATQLQTLLHEPVQEDDGLGSAQQLALQILRSFTEILSALSSCAESAQIAAVDCGVSAASGGRCKKGPPGVKERRGCYKRRRTLDSWVTVSSTREDGCAWRKYGQKDIMSSKYPRCYFRCTHKYEGCKATKQVQRIKEDPIMYQTTYFNHHTCTETLRPPHLIVDSDPVEPNLISFGSNIQSKQDQYSPNPAIISQVKQEFKEDHAKTSDQDLSSDEAKSTLQDPWQDTNIRLESLGYKPVWPPIMSSYQEEVFDQSCESTSLHGLEVNQLGDIDYSWYFD